MANISKTAQAMPASAIRKLVPYADAAKKQGVKVYHLNLGQPDIKSPECALNAIKNYKADHVSYSHSAGLIQLREGLVEKYYKKIGIDIEVPELIVTVAGSESVNLALTITCDPGDEVIVLEPFYTNYNTFAFMNGITLKAIRTDMKQGFQVPPVEEFEKAITPKTKTISAATVAGKANKTQMLHVLTFVFYYLIIKCQLKIKHMICIDNILQI
jgi:aspartate aminotransferase